MPTSEPTSPLAADLRIGLVCLHTDPYAEPGSGDVGGMNVVVRHTAAAMAQFGADVEVITRLAGPVPTREVVDGVTVHRLPAGPAHPVPKGEHEGFIEEFARGLHALGPYDVLHSQHWFSGAAALGVARGWGVPHVQSFHSIAAPPQTALAHGERPESPGRLAGEARLARESDAVVAVSHAEQATAITRLGADPARVWVVHPGVDTELFHPALPDADAVAADAVAADAVDAAARPGLLIAARLEPLKGVDLAIEALARLRGLSASRPILRIAGGATADGGYVDSLAARARELGVADDVELLGPRTREELATLMRESALVLVPSHSETYGLVALEASASGVPVVASDAGGLRESVLDGRTGLRLSSRDPGEWARAIARLLDDDDLRSRLGAAGRELALGRTWRGAARLTLDVYAELIARTGT